MRIFLTLFILIVCRFVAASPTLHTDLPLGYLEQTTGAKGQPLVIFLHGYGSNEEDLFMLKDRLPGNYTYLSVRAPMRLDNGKYQWFTKSQNPAEYDGVAKDIDHGIDLLERFIPKAAEKYHTRISKVVLIGFSQGAMMSYEIGLLHPASFRAFAALSGKLMPALRSRLKPSKPLTKQIVFIGHGVTDQIIPYSSATQAQAMLDKLGVQVTFHDYEKLEHAISDAEVTDLRAWLESFL